MIQSSPLLLGSCDLLVLLILRRARLHCWGIAQRVQQLSRDAVQLNEHAVNVSLDRMQQCGWVEMVRRRGTAHGAVPVYRLTRLGLRQFELFQVEYHRVTKGIARIMRAA